MLHEEECVLLKESNMEDPLADPLCLPSDGLGFDDDEKNSERSESESSEHSKDQMMTEVNDKPEKEGEIVNEENFPFECEICGKRFKKKPGYISHMKFSHNPEPRVRKKKYKKQNYTEKHYKCKICVYGTLRKNNFEVHMKKHERHDEKFLTSEEYQVRCELCLAPIRSEKKLAQHMRISHPKVKSRCDVCFMKFKARSTLRRHLKNFHPEEAPKLIQELDDEIERERALKRETRPERLKEKRKEREKMKKQQKKEMKKIAKVELKGQKMLAKIEKKKRIELEKLQLKEAKRLERIRQRELKKMGIYEETFIIKEEPFDPPETVIKTQLKPSHNLIDIPIKQEPEIEINEVIKEFPLS